MTSSVYQNATISAPPVRYANATISAPPVRFEQPPSIADEPEYLERPAKRPKISIAEAMMAKMGYVKGQGLGKNNDGVTTHLEVKIRKPAPGGQSSIFDDGEGNKVKSAQVWDVRGGERKKDEPGKFGEESCVVVTWGCVDGVDWTENAERDDGGIRQDMGEVFSTKVSMACCEIIETKLTMDKFGPVERLQVDESNTEGVVYIQFKSVLSALNVSFYSAEPATLMLTMILRLSIGSKRDGNTEAGTFAHGTMMNASSTLVSMITDRASSYTSSYIFDYECMVSRFYVAVKKLVF